MSSTFSPRADALRALAEHETTLAELQRAHRRLADRRDGEARAAYDRALHAARVTGERARAAAAAGA